MKKTIGIKLTKGQIRLLERYFNSRVVDAINQVYETKTARYVGRGAVEFETDLTKYKVTERLVTALNICVDAENKRRLANQ